MMNYKESDINRQFARDAYRGTSFSSEKRGDNVVNSYINEMRELEAEFSQWVTPENEAAMTADLEAYRLGYLRRLNAFLGAQSRTMSTMIAGPSNFPVRSQEKKWNTADKRRDEWLKWSEQTLERMRRTYNPKLASRVISSDDSEAVAKLQAKIAQAEATQELMKKANAIVRKAKLTDEEKIAELVKLEGISEKVAPELLKPDFAGRKGFADYMLTNNSANIRRMKERVGQLEREQARRELEAALAVETDNEPGVTDHGNGITVIENTDINRLQIKFPGKPAREVIAKLKANGFHWSPTQGAWQRLLNNNARYAAKQVLGV